MNIRKADLDRLVERAESAENKVARNAREMSTLRKRASGSVDRADRIERAIASHASGRCACDSDRLCLVLLSRLVPASRLRP